MAVGVGGDGSVGFYYNSADRVTVFDGFTVVVGISPPGRPQ